MLEIHDLLRRRLQLLFAVAAMMRIPFLTLSSVLLTSLVAADPGSASDEDRSPGAALSLWAEIEDASQSELFRDFATRFPENPLARLAQTRANELDGVAAPPDPARFPGDAATRAAAEPVAELVEEPSFETIRAKLGYRAAKRANVRGGPSTDTPVLGQLEPGDLVQVESREGDWWQVRLDGGTEAYVHGPLVEDLGLQAADFRGVLNPKVETIAPIQPAAAPDCLDQPTRRCVRAMIDAEYANIEQISEQVFVASHLAGAFFKLGDVESGWSYLLRAVRLARTAPEDTYGEARQRAYLLGHICRTLATNAQPRIALAVCRDALSYAANAKSTQEYYSDSEQQFEAVRDVASSLGTHPELLGHAKAAADQALAMAAKLPAISVWSAAEKRTDAIRGMVDVYFNMGLVTESLRVSEQAYRSIGAIEIMGAQGISVSYERYSNLYWNTRNLTDLGFIDWAWDLAWQMPDAPHGTYKGNALGYVIRTAVRVDRNLAEEFAGRIGRTHDGIWGGDGLQFLIEAGFQDLAERILPRRELSESELYYVGKAYVAIGEIEKAMTFAAQLQDEDYRKWLYREVAAKLVTSGTPDRVESVLGRSHSAAEAESIEEGIAQAHSERVRELVAQGDGAAALEAVEADEFGRLDDWILGTISAHAVATGNRDLVMGAARAAADETPYSKVFVYTDLLLLSK